MTQYTPASSFSATRALAADDFWEGRWYPAKTARGHDCFRWVWGMPRIPPQTLKCTFYLYRTVEQAESGHDFGGTGFFVGITLDDPSRAAVFAVTNWHVASQCPVIRLNKLGGGSEPIDLTPDQWIVDMKGHDIAVTPLIPDKEKFDVNYVMDTMFATSDVVSANSIGPGENVFMSGRFVDADGGATNQPAVRFGHLSLMPVPLQLRMNKRKRKSYCVDVHSRSGYSGSPVFVFRKPGDDLTTGNLNMADQFLFLLGIHHAQFPEMWEVKRTKRAAPSAEIKLPKDITHIEGLSGMTCVAPADEILKLIREHPKTKAFLDDLNARIAAHRALGGSSPDESPKDES